MIRPNLVLYHCNDSFRCHNFVHSKKYMIVSEEDGIWLGTGMYFWDNMANARFWMRKKRKDDPHRDYSIISANVFMDKLLDLTDNDICNKIEKMWEKYLEVNGINDEKNSALGYKLNVLFKSIEMLRENYYVIKIYGKYNKTPKNKLWSYSIEDNNVEPIGTVKCIYNVRNEEAIGDKRFV